MSLRSNARLYAPTRGLAEVWRALFARVAAAAGVPLEPLDHPAPAPLEDLWRRDDLGLAFLCGFPFARGDYPVVPVAAPVPRGATGPFYATDLVARADGDVRDLADAFGRRVGWTVEHSQSGFNALRHHLLRHRTPERPRLFAASVGPLVTPRAVIEALRDGRIDLGPLDSHVHALLKAEEPETAAALRVVDTTVPTPMPLLVASAGADPEAVTRLRAALLALAADETARPLLARLHLTGFAAVERADYRPLLDGAEAAERAGYPLPA